MVRQTFTSAQLRGKKLVIDSRGKATVVDRRPNTKPQRTKSKPRTSRSEPGRVGIPEADWQYQNEPT